MTTPHEAADVGVNRARFTVVFEGNIRRLPFNPFTTHDTRFGTVAGCSADDALARTDELEELLAEARLQIEYLHDKFKETGSGNTVVARIRLALNPRGDGGVNDG